MLRTLLWRLLGLIALAAAVALGASLLDGRIGVLLRAGGRAGAANARPGAGSARVAAVRDSTGGAGAAPGQRAWPAGIAEVAHTLVHGAWSIADAAWLAGPWLAGVLALTIISLLGARVRDRRRRRYARFEVEAYRADSASAESLVTMFAALHKRLQRRSWSWLRGGQPSLALEIHHAGPRGDGRRGANELWLAASCPLGLEAMVETALRGAYPNCRLRRVEHQPPRAGALLRLTKRYGFIGRAKVLDRFEHAREPAVNRVLSVMSACPEPALVQLALTPAPALFERYARYLFKRRERRLSRERRRPAVALDRSLVDDAELRGALELQHGPLFFADLRVLAPSRETCERIASELRAAGAENRLVARSALMARGVLGTQAERVRRGEGNPLPSLRRGVFAPSELAALWHLPSVDFAAAPFARVGVPRIPAPPAIMRPRGEPGALRDALGPVSIHPSLRRQNTAVPGAVEQGKTSYLVATVAEDLRRERCAVIVLDPKGDAAEAAVSMVPASRTCTLLDFTHPTCGFNPLAVDAPADVIADYVVGALKNLFTDADIRASSDRYLRNAIIAVLAYDRRSTLWDAARLLSVGEDGYAYRNAVAARVRAMPEFKEISEFFTAELSAQLADARSTTTAKLDAPVNKLARLLNSPSIKRVLLNDSLRVDFDALIARSEVLVVKGALGAMGAGNTSVLMQLLVGMLDAALARQQDMVAAGERVAVALKVDEAPLVLNRGFAETMALKRSAGLETVACWQTDAQWVDREVREQLDALFAHRVYFATSSVRDARASVELMMAEFSDSIRPGSERLATLGRPDARLHLPKHHAIVSWLTEHGRQAPFVAQTLPLRVDRVRLLDNLARQAERGGAHLSDLRQPHWATQPRSSRAPEVARAPEGARAREGVWLGARPPGHGRASGAGGAHRLATAVPARSEDTDPAAPAPESYRELVELDRAQSVRWARAAQAAGPMDPAQLDLEILALVARLGHVLTTQVHRRFNPARSLTTTQRRLKRLADAGLLARLQFHRRDGGGISMCCVITDAGAELVRARESVLDSRQQAAVRTAHGRAERAVEGSARTPAVGAQRLRAARHDVHVAGWLLALERAPGMRTGLIRGGAEASPGAPVKRGRAAGPVNDQAPLGPGDLRLPQGRTPHGFLRTVDGPDRREVTHFETVRPDAIVELGRASGHGLLDLLIERDDRLGTASAARKLERYDHFLTGWSAHIGRYGVSARAQPAVLFVCRDRARARDVARRADALLCACRAYAGEYPAEWEYLGRLGIGFAAERDIHEGLTRVYRVPPLPPEVRVAHAHGDPAAALTDPVHGDLSALGEEA